MLRAHNANASSASVPPGAGVPRITRKPGNKIKGGAWMNGGCRQFRVWLWTPPCFCFTQNLQSFRFLSPHASDQRPEGVLAYAPLRSSLKRRLGGITLRPHKTCLPSGKARPGERLLWGRMGDPYPLRQQSPVCLDVSSPIPLTILTFPQTIRNIIPSTGPILGKMHTRILL